MRRLDAVAATLADPELRTRFAEMAENQRLRELGRE